MTACVICCFVLAVYALSARYSESGVATLQLDLSRAFESVLPRQFPDVPNIVDSAKSKVGGTLNTAIPEVVSRVRTAADAVATRVSGMVDAAVPKMFYVGSGHLCVDVQRIKKEDESEESLLVPEFEEGTSDDDDDGKLDEDGEEALYIRHTPKPNEQVETVGWGNVKRTTYYINRYGKKGASRYRMEMLADSAEYEERTKNDADPQKVSNPNNRYGDKKLFSGHYKYTKRHIIGIWGVAWEGADAGACMDDLDRIDPAKVTDKWPTTFVLVMWNIDGEHKKAWETDG
ncbi:hypothetical protein B0T11DRAFT_329497 [Plectosphaerella cucumerina]|uniref:Uncharacterized protein n=1 Tax=Plectosphaerella cucumerina TaxID=40658 RepID=A0A8K0TL81_9PEZI|nr:hypothetical protein B0T11DRAFT_329497 [Plectosphaerella cucumerina]